MNRSSTRKKTPENEQELFCTDMEVVVIDRAERKDWAHSRLPVV